MPSGIIYELARKLKSAKNMVETLATFSADVAEKLRNEVDSDPTRVWTTVNESGLFELLLAELTSPSRDPVRFTCVCCYCDSQFVERVSFSP